ncbi:MAG: esterase/lipase family protein [Leptolyngbyaceae cyanobacterium]
MTHNDKPAVVLVHGLWNTVGIFGRLRPYLENRGWSVYAVSLTPNNGTISIEQQAEQLYNFVKQSLGAEQPFSLVGVSMGGLASRYYLQRLDGRRRVRRFIGVVVPHHGSMLAWFRRDIGVTQMRPGSAFLADLNQDMEQLSVCRPLWLWTPYDVLVLPAYHCCLPIGENQRLPVRTHDGMLWDERSLAAIAHGLIY